MINKYYSGDPDILELFIFIMHIVGYNKYRNFIISYDLFIKLYNYIDLVPSDKPGRWCYHDSFSIIIDRYTTNLIQYGTSDEMLIYERRIKIEKIMNRIQ
jgi:hypothetical protein